VKLKAQIRMLFVPMIVAGCCIQGSGDIVEESRAIESFEKIRIEVPADLVVSSGETDEVEIRTDDNLMKHIVTKILDSTLVIKSDVKECLDASTLTIHVSTPQLSELRIEGSSLVQLDGEFASESILLSIDGSGSISAEEPLSADLISVQIDGSGEIALKDIDAIEIRTDIDGSGDVDLAGVAPTQTIEIDGSGEIKADGLETKSTSINIDGSGTCLVQATETLIVHIDGSGEVYYSGSPSVDQSIDGSGTVQSTGV
jgi:hypothetical protein